MPQQDITVLHGCYEPANPSSDQLLLVAISHIYVEVIGVSTPKQSLEMIRFIARKWYAVINTLNSTHRLIVQSMVYTDINLMYRPHLWYYY